VTLSLNRTMSSEIRNSAAALIRGRSLRVLRGSVLGVLWPEALILTGMGALLLLLASLRFRKSLD